MAPSISRFNLILLSIVALLVVFVSVPFLAGSGIIPSIDFNTSEEIVDPTETFDLMSDVDEGAYSGTWKTEKTYYTLHNRNVTTCNTYTLTGELELVDEGNGLGESATAYTFDTNEPTAVTCKIDSDVLEDSEEDKEVLILILDYDRSSGEYSEVESVSEIE